MTPVGVFLLSWFAAVLASTFILGCVIAASESAKVKFVSTVLIGAVWSSPFLGLFFQVVLAGTFLEFGPSFMKRRGDSTVFAFMSLALGAALFWAFIRMARSDMLSRATATSQDKHDAP